MLEKPASIASNPFMSAKWDEITSGRDFAPSLAPTVAILCQWHAIAERCMEDVSGGGEVSVAYVNDLGDLKALPQIGTLQKASAEIRALNKQLGINDEAAPDQGGRREAVIHVIQSKRQSKAQGRRGAAAG